MAVDLTPWPPVSGPQARLFAALCEQAAAELRAAPEKELLARLGDPRALHRRLYGPALPASLQHLAGAYRGSPHPDLANFVVAFAFTENEGTGVLARPEAVAAMMFQYKSLMGRFLATTDGDAGHWVLWAARLISAFGYIHPFWDGNGHIQRMTFEALLGRKGIAMNGQWSIHPCPYGVETHRALAARDPARIAASMMKFVAA